MRQFTKAEQCRNLMYKRSMLAKLNFFEIRDYLEDMIEVCGNIHYAFDDDETLINAFDGNEDEAHEFKFSFSDLEYEAEHLCEKFYEMYGYSDDPEREFNDITVSLIGEWFQILGFDSYRDDYFAFDYSYLEEVAIEESQKRTLRKTKKQMLDDIGLTMAFLLKFSELQYRYESMKATVDIFRDENIAVLKLVKDIDEKYKSLFDKSGKLDTWHRGKEIREFDRMVNELPGKYWVE